MSALNNVISYYYNDYIIYPETNRFSIKGYLEAHVISTPKYFEIKTIFDSETKSHEEIYVYNNDKSESFVVNLRDNDFPSTSPHSKDIYISTKELFGTLGINIGIEKDDLNKYLIFYRY